MQEARSLQQSTGLEGLVYLSSSYVIAEVEGKLILTSRYPISLGELTRDFKEVNGVLSRLKFQPLTSLELDNSGYINQTLQEQEGGDR